ncbi:MAG: DNA-binding protein [Alphaproteobacteria bacterium]|nr:MAG: DNA-binding protein [Alphaproteobacteria bacterium]
MNPNPVPNLTTRQAARRLGLSPRTLEKWRVEGNGPPFYKIGRRVAYLEADLVEWLRGRRRRSTSEQSA